MPNYSTLQLIKEGALAILQIDNGKVNAIDTQLSKDLESAFLELDGDDTIDGVVLTGRAHCFCAGLNVMSLATADRDGLRDFFASYFRAIQAMVRFTKPFIAAVTGFAPAGGTVLALAADYRIMGRGPKHTMGLNEFNMSLQIPKIMGDVFAHYLGEARAWDDVQNATMYTADEAVAHGLVNAAAEVEEVLDLAKAQCQKLMNVHPPVFKRTKRYFRSGLLAAVDHDVEAMVDVVEEDFSDPKFKMMMEMFVASLKG